MLLITMAVQLFLVSNCCAKTHGRPVNDDPISPLGVTLNVTDTEVVIDNGIVQITIANPEGHLLGVRYDGVNNLLEAPNKESNRGYWDVVWDTKDYDGTDWLIGSKFNVIVENEDQVEVSFTYKWDSTTWNTSEHYWRIPANVDRRFQYMAISDDRQRIMPLPHDRESGLPLAFKEAVLLTNPTNPDLRGEVDDKYQYSCEDKDNKVHGWISLDPQIGFWIITPSDEFRSAGPIKQDLTSHVGPTALAMFHSAHYAGLDVTMKFQEGEPWKKVFGPYYVYLNSIYENGDFHELWDDAKHQMKQETRSWPYEFPLSEDFPKSVERGFAYGRLLVHDRYRRRTMMPASYAWIGLAAPGEAGSWQTETKGYQFWTRADRNGGFLIKGIHEGVFNLFAWVPGFIGDYVYAENIIIEPGSVIQLGNLVYEPPRNGPTLWQIGIPDRTALEFYVPEPSSLFVNKLYTDSDHNKFRQYGLWERYAELYPENDLIYTVGESDYHTDWFFAHVTRKGENNTYLPTTWQIIFTVNDLIPSSNYTLRIALASATRSDLQVQFNHKELMIPHFSTKMIGSDNAIARHGIHGLYRLFNIDVPSEWLYDGNNTIYLKQSRHDSPFYGVIKAPAGRKPTANPNAQPTANPNGGVRVNATAKQVVLDNGIVQLTLQVPQGYIIGIRYGGLENILAVSNRPSDRGYWDIASTNSDDNDRTDDQIRFLYMAVSDKLQRVMPMNRDRETGKPLAYKEAVHLTNPTNPKIKGEVDDKYQYAFDHKDNKLHGWVCTDPSVGIWLITPSDEFRTRGPHKQDLTSHVGPNMLSVFHSIHYAGPDLIMKFTNGEPWKKVYGPYFVHLNSGKGDPRALWQEAKNQLQEELKSWPYKFPVSEDFPKANQRGSVVGKLLVKDGSKPPVPANLGWVGLAQPGEVGSWQSEMKGYQFWAQTDREGKFTIPNVHVGKYNLYAWAPGFIGDYKSASVIDIAPGKQINLGDQVYTPPRSGETLWEIGFPDRSAAEFFVPDPSPNFANPILNDQENKYRQYGLWDRYSEIYPKQDLTYTIGVSNHTKDWFYAHVLRYWDIASTNSDDNDRTDDQIRSKPPVPANLGWVGLAQPGEVGSWQSEMKGYQFWAQTDREGKFTIPNVHVGKYNLYAWAPGFIGDYKSASVIDIAPGKQINLGDQVYTPPRSGETLWEIGFPDRSAAEFFVPDPSPNFANPILNDQENKYRQYGLWDRYSEIYPKQDLTYTIGVSNHTKDWFYAHVLRKTGPEIYQPTVWQVVFPLKDVVPNGNYTLQIALAAANFAALQVRVNNPDSIAVFSTSLVGKDNAIARHGIHGLYQLYSVGIPGNLLKSGQNTIFLRQPRNNGKFCGFMYDYVRLEGPASPK
ncbi:hypothetical protein BVRB_6g152780 isoform A [Beta vulgaris subsp. vulgaris]|nr:hypothetical protein BVRB_6g152780 isoform A [Beta vulgaris subsp. vulgaris]